MSFDGIMSLTDDEHFILKLAAQGWTLAEITAEFNRVRAATPIKETRLRDQLASRTYPKLHVRNIHGATAIYANWMGLRLKLVTGDLAVPQQEIVSIGGFTYHACLIASALRHPSEITCLVENTRYTAPSDLASAIDQLRANSISTVHASGELGFEKTANLLFIRNARADNEQYCPITLELQHGDYFTRRAVLDNLTPSQRQRYQVDPRRVAEAALPMPIGVLVHVVAGSGQKRRLIIQRRSAALGGGGECYGSTAQGHGEADQDIKTVGTTQQFDFVHAMIRELAEERIEVPRSDFDRQSQMLCIVMNYADWSWSIASALFLPKADPEKVRDRIAEAKEGVAQAIPFPDHNEPATAIALRGVCEHLARHQWVPDSAISLIILMQRLFGEFTVHTQLSAASKLMPDA